MLLPLFNIFLQDSACLVVIWSFKQGWHLDKQHNITLLFEILVRATPRSIKTLSWTPFSIMTRSIKAYFATLSIHVTQKNKHMPLCWMSLCWGSRFLYCYAACRYAECRYAECRYAECRHFCLTFIGARPFWETNRNLTSLRSALR